MDLSIAFGRKTMIISSESIVDVLTDSNGYPQVGIVIGGELAKDPTKAFSVISGLEKIIQSGGEDRPNIDIGMSSHYALNWDRSVLDLRFIDPNNKKNSETMVTLSHKNQAVFDTKMVESIMSSFVFPKGKLPKFDKKDPKPKLA